ncbi:MAG: ABC transporter substrate-binding protein [Burkholderiales bacterium]
MIKKLAIALGIGAALHGGAWAQETIKIGVMDIDSGPYVTVSKYHVDGAKYMVDVLNAQGGALGRKYELVVQSFQGTPATAVAAATKLVDQGGALAILGMNFSSTSIAVAAKMPQMNALFIDNSSASSDLIGKYCNQNYFHVAVTDSMNLNGLRAQVKASGAKTWDLLSVDYSAGHDFAKGFATLVAESGGKIQSTLFAPLTTTDFGSYISQMGAKPSEALMVFFPGSGAIALAKQQQQFGWFGKYKTVLTQFFTNDTLIDAQGDTTAGLFTLQGYHSAWPGERNAAFVKAFESRFKYKPTYPAGDMVVGIEVLHQAILKAKSTDVAAVRAALRGLKTQTIVGDVEMRAADHQLLRPMGVAQAVKVSDGKGTIVLRSVEPTSRITPDVSPECKMPS